LKVILTVAGLSPEDGGPSRSIPALAESLARAGIEVEMLTCESGNRLAPPLLADESLVRTSVLPYSCRTVPWRGRQNGFTSILRTASHGAGQCIFQDNGLWLPANHAVACAARKLNRLFVISPRGMLTRWALQFKGWKKRVAWWLYQKRDLQSARVLHATSRSEADGFRAAGLKQPIAVIPNGVDLPDWREPSRPRPDVRTVLFLSRIHPKKGLLNLVEAWGRLNPKGWQVVIAGGDEAGHRAEVEGAIRAHKLEASFHFTGPVDGGERWSLFRQADLFVLPSFSENFGIAVAEALACGVPVVTTQGAPWEDLITHQCGWWPAVGSGPLGEALRAALSQTDEQRREMGRRGRQLVEAKYSWPGVAAQTISAYRWMLGECSKPEWVLE
jgi:glycosyltransferase involved in cell wall biosynthesis